MTEPTTATRLAARFPGLQVYAWDPESTVAAESVPIAGKLRNYSLGIDLPDGQAHDNWERAAMLIHERYVAHGRGSKRNTPVTVPWAKLVALLPGVEPRQVRNALQTVEQVGGHTWNTWGDAPDDADTEALDAWSHWNSCSSSASTKMPSTRWPRPSSRTGVATSRRGDGRTGRRSSTPIVQRRDHDKKLRSWQWEDTFADEHC